MDQPTQELHLVAGGDQLLSVWSSPRFEGMSAASAAHSAEPRQTQSSSVLRLAAEATE